MAWVVDTCVLIDVRAGDPNFSESSAACLGHHSTAGIVISPIVYVELAPMFRGDKAAQDAFLASKDVITHDAWDAQDTAAAHTLWNVFTSRRKQYGLARRPVADVLIAAFARRFQGLITRNTADFRTIAPELALVDATAFAQPQS